MTRLSCRPGIRLPQASLHREQPGLHAHPPAASIPLRTNPKANATSHYRSLGENEFIPPQQALPATPPTPTPHTPAKHSPRKAPQQTHPRQSHHSAPGPAPTARQPTATAILECRPRAPSILARSSPEGAGYPGPGTAPKKTPPSPARIAPRNTPRTVAGEGPGVGEQQVAVPQNTIDIPTL
jgi:hypothetical protein